MATRLLPARPDLSKLKKLAKQRLAELRAGSPGARVQLADAQRAIARDYGFPSWRKLKAHVDDVVATLAAGGLTADSLVDADVTAFLEVAVSFEAPAPRTEAFLRPARAILDRRPDIARAHLLCACVLGDADAAGEFLERDSASATRPGGPKAWPPLLYLCFSRFLVRRPKRTARRDGFTRVAEMLLERGADPNSRFVLDGTHETALYGAAGIANHAGLAQLLLDAGADPDDQQTDGVGAETLYHVAEHTDDHACLRLVLERRPRPEAISYCLCRKLDFEDLKGATLFLDRGADPNYRTPIRDGDTPFMHAIRRGRSVAIVELLIRRGADVNRPNAAGMTPLQLANRMGRREVADLLRTHGAVEDDDRRERFLAACAAGDRRAAQRVLRDEPDLVARLTPAELRILPDAAAENRAAAVRAMLDLGFDVNAPGDWGGAAVHQAAWHGHAPLVKLLIQRGADLAQKQEFGGDALSTAIHGAAHAGHANALAVVDAVARAMKPADVAPYARFAKEKDLPGVAELLQKIADKAASRPARTGAWKPIMDAAYAGNAAELRRLLDAGADPNALGTTGHRYRPLHRAIEHKKTAPKHAGHDECVRLLLERGADPKMRATHGRVDALQLAATQEPRFVPLLADAFRPLDVFHAAVLCDDARVAALLKKDPALATARDDAGWTPLHHCAASAMYKLGSEQSAAQLRVARMLLDAGADPSATYPWNDEWPIPVLYHCCGQHDNPALAEVLFRAGAEPYDNETVYHAADEGHAACLALIERHADPKKLAAECTTCLNTQLHWGRTRGAPWLLAHGADPNVIGRWGDASLHAAVRNSANDAIIRLLLKHGADPMLKNAEGDSAVALARKLKRDRIVRLLQHR